MNCDTPDPEQPDSSRSSALRAADTSLLAAESIPPGLSLEALTVETPGALPLPVAEISERSDAARNRQLLLDAAEELVSEFGADGVTMDAVAKRAGVGKGTVFRRFGNRAGLMLSLLDQSEQKLQAAFMFGPPPLGPGAPPLQRLIAFGRARLAGIEVEGEMRRAADESGRYASAPYNISKTHVSLLLRQLGATGDIALLADTLLANLDAALVLHQIRVAGYPPERIADHWEKVVRALVTPPQ
ncbi:putative transcriptional regulator, TetR family [Nocardia nova SH22a]|uniref:Putative transcriptional regulator, TetR family n=1 Tax=Nocardia nova SH22a TaxID=1415166 RepID=W5TCQ9_9NOCA|nr:putative transcriptional regulator, TetR family [Nocardia nova SH22a]